MCNHETVIFNKCMDCNTPMVCVNPERPDNVPLPNLTKYRIPPNIQDRAMIIYSKMHVNMKKGNKRKELDFFLIYSAYKELGIFVDPKYIAKLVGITNHSISKAHATFSVSSTGYNPPINIGNACVLIPEFCALIGCIESNVIKEIRDIGIDIIQKHPELSEHSPQKLAAAFIQAYYDSRNYRLNKQLLCDIVNVTEGTMSTIVKIVRTAIESPC